VRAIRLCASLLLFALGGETLAEPSTRVAWTVENLRFVQGGDAEKGRQIGQTCEGCHAGGPENGQTPYPSLHGQSASYLYKQLRDYKDGSRANDLMAAFVANLSDQDMADVAAWYSRETAPRASEAVDVPKEIERLVERGDSRRVLAPCAVCHGRSGEGQAVDNPALAGQKAAYLEQTLLAYRSGARHNDLYGRMRLIAQQLSAEEIRQLALYYARLNP
jgi:cytochrome c553